MQVYKAFFRILAKQKGQMIMYLCIFASITGIMAAQGAKNGKEMFQASSYEFAVFDEDQSVASHNLISYLAKDNKEVKLENENEAIQDALYNRQVKCVLYIPKGFGASLEEGKELLPIEISGVPGTVYSETFQNLVSQYVSIVRGYIVGGFSVEEAMLKAEAAAGQEVEVNMADGGQVGQSNEYYFFSYIPYVMVSMCIVGIGPILIIFHKKEVRARNNCSAYSLSRINLELFAGTVIAGLGIGAIFFLLTLAMNGKAILSTRGLLFGLNMLSFVVVSLGIVFLVGQLAKKTTILSMISNVIGLGMSFLCGVFVPLELLGDGIVKVAHFLPAYWYIVAARAIDSYNSGDALGEIGTAMGIQLLFGIAFVCIGLAYSRTKMKQLEA